MIKDEYLVELQQVDWDSLDLASAKQMFEKLARQWDFKDKIEDDIDIANGMTCKTKIMKFAWNCCLKGLGLKVLSYGR